MVDSDLDIQNYIKKINVKEAMQWSVVSQNVVHHKLLEDTDWSIFSAESQSDESDSEFDGFNQLEIDQTGARMLTLDADWWIQRRWHV